MSDADEKREDDSGPEHMLMESVLRLPELAAVAEDLVEVGVDAFIDNPVVDAIPVVKSLRALYRGGVAFREAYLNQKLARLLIAMGKPTEEDLRRWRKRLEADGGTRETGERVLAVVDRVTSVWKAELIGRVFRAYLDGGIDRSQFLRTVEMIDAALTEDLRLLLSAWPSDIEGDPVWQRLIAVGLMADRSSHLVTEESEPPAPSEDGELLRRVNRP